MNKSASPKYRFHKSTGQAVVSINGHAVQLGPFGSEKSHQKYQELLGQWREIRRQQRPDCSGESEADNLVALPNLQLRYKRGYPITLNELALAYRKHARVYYRKNGEVTREAELVVEVLRVLLKQYGDLATEEFGPVALKQVRQAMIDELDWSRKYINKQVNRLVRMFGWAVENELSVPGVHQALKSVQGLKKGRTEARETKRVTPPKYRLHKSTNQAIVSFNGKKIYLGPYGSEKSHRRYQEVVEQWRSLRHEIRPPSDSQEP